MMDRKTKDGMCEDGNHIVGRIANKVIRKSEWEREIALFKEDSRSYMPTVKKGKEDNTLVMEPFCACPMCGENITDQAVRGGFANLESGLVMHTISPHKSQVNNVSIDHKATLENPFVDAANHFLAAFDFGSGIAQLGHARWIKSEYSDTDRIKVLTRVRIQVTKKEDDDFFKGLKITQLRPIPESLPANQFVVWFEAWFDSAGNNVDPGIFASVVCKGKTHRFGSCNQSALAEYKNMVGKLLQNRSDRVIKKMMHP